ncbi:periplasmic protein TonB [uncultured Gammaproteobacteria bacterium]
MATIEGAALGGRTLAAPDALRLYARAVWARLERFKPKGSGLHGTVSLRFVLAADGGLFNVEITASSGDEALDRAALTAMRAAAPFPPPPDGASSEQRTFAIPFQFR